MVDLEIYKPVKELEEIESRCRLVRSAISGEILELSRLKPISNEVRYDKEYNSVGTLPVSVFASKKNPVSCFIAPTCVGIDPDIILKLKSKYVKSVSIPIEVGIVPFKPAN